MPERIGRSDAEILTIFLVRHLLHRTNESGFLTEIRRDYPGWFPKLPHPSEFNRRARWLRGAFERTPASPSLTPPPACW